jgi:hypothetical protein
MVINTILPGRDFQMASKTPARAVMASDVNGLEDAGVKTGLTGTYE